MCVQGNVIAICLEQLTDPHPLLRQWLAICLGRVWYNYEAARWCAVRDSAPEKLYCLLADPLPEVRLGAVLLLSRGFFLAIFINQKGLKMIRMQVTTSFMS